MINNSNKKRDNNSTKRKATRRELLDLRNKHINERFNYLFSEKRIRYDDVMGILEKEFYLTEVSISRILKNKS